MLEHPGYGIQDMEHVRQGRFTGRPGDHWMPVPQTGKWICEAAFRKIRMLWRDAEDASRCWRERADWRMLVSFESIHA